MAAYINRKRNSMSTITLGFLALLLISGSVHAVPIRVDFTGSISFAGSFLDPTGLLTQGDPLTGFWELETTTPDTDPVASRGSYAQSGSPVFHIDIGGHLFQDNTITIQILDDHTIGIGTIDAYDVLGAGTATSSIAGFSALNMQITLRDTQIPLDAITSDALPTTAPDPSSFDQVGQAEGQLTGTFMGEQFFVNLMIESTSVVEPGSLGLLTIGLFGVVFSRGRRMAPARNV